MNNKLVAYFSATGKTAKVAEKLAAGIGADIYEITSEVKYTKADLNWMNKKSRSSGFGNTVAELHPSAPGAKIIEARVLSGIITDVKISALIDVCK